MRTDYSPTSSRREKRWTILKNDDAGAETMQRESAAIQKRMTSVAVTSTKSGEAAQVTQESFSSWKRRVGKDTGFVVKLAENVERLVLTRREMKELPPGVFEGELVRKYAIEDPTLKKKLRGCDVWKCV